MYSKISTRKVRVLVLRVLYSEYFLAGKVLGTLYSFLNYDMYPVPGTRVHFLSTRHSSDNQQNTIDFNSSLNIESNSPTHNILSESVTYIFKDDLDNILSQHSGRTSFNYFQDAPPNRSFVCTDTFLTKNISIPDKTKHERNREFIKNIMLQFYKNVNNKTH